MDGSGNLYGTTYLGGVSRAGTVFMVTPDGVHTVLHAFTGGDGSHPFTGVVMDAAGNLYGTTNDTGFGNVYKLTPDGVETVLHSFAGGSDGESLPRRTW